MQRLSKEDDSFSEEMALAYCYEGNSLLVFRPGGESGRLYNLTTGKWHETLGSIEAFHYGWPDTWVRQKGVVGKLRIREAEDIAAGRQAPSEPGEMIAVKTRPVKLGDPFAVKKLKEVEAVWPDGIQRPIKVYGAIQPGHWHLLGVSSRGRMRMRGSGWRFFLFETFAVKAETGYLLPTLRVDVDL